MFRDQARELSLEIAEETRQRIREDHRRASVRVAQLLELVEEHLLDADLQVESLQRWCGQHDKNISTRFAEELGLPPWAYITQCRMEIAGQMLIGSKLAVWRIGLAVGYVSGHSFGRAFKRWCGKSPKAFRNAEGARSAAESPPPKLLSRAEIERALAGDLAPEEAKALIGELGELQERVRSNYQIPSPPPPGREALEPAMAARLWRWIEHEPLEIQKAAIDSQQAAFHTPALFHLLCTESIAAGAVDDVTGLQIASLALASLPGVAQRLGKPSIYLFARAYTVVGLAFTRSESLDEAAEAFRVATRMLNHDGDKVHPVVFMELCLYRARLETARGEAKAAKQLLDAGIQIWDALMQQLKQAMDAEASAES